MITRRSAFHLTVMFACSLLATAAYADKISSKDFDELPKGAKMSQVVAAVGEPASKKMPKDREPYIEWHYPNIPWAVNGKPCHIVLFFDKNTERLSTMNGCD
jgi:hypothetical protein